MTALLEILKRQIQATGPLTVAEYMSLCLAHPQYGYYITRDPLGKAGDFTTAPEISQIFGELIGFWFAQNWQDRGNPKQIDLVECGPGRGTLMADVLRAATYVPGFVETLNIHLVETSPSLRKAQKEKLKGHNVTWHDDLSSLPARDLEIPTFFLANEFFDALPVQQFQYTDKGWFERAVGLNEETDKLSWQLIPKPMNFEALVTEVVRGEAKVGDIAEASPISLAYASQMAERITGTNGVGLFIDYGYGKSTIGDSFQAMKDHQFCDVLTHCGEADLTCHVDFQRLAGMFAEERCRAAPLLEQGIFLKRLGIEMRSQQLLQQATETQAKQIATGTQRLIDPKQMGQLFKVLAVTSTNGPALAGFEAA